MTQLHDAASGSFDELAVLYCESFPPEERKSIEQLRRIVASPGYRVWVCHHGHRLVAFAVVHVSTALPVALLEYLAVLPSLRRRGVGRQLLEHVLPPLLADGRDILIEAESDDPADFSSSQEVPPSVLAERHRRKQFYRSLGAREILGLSYRMPAVASGTPPPMHLLLCPSRPRRTTVPASTVGQWLTSLYVEVYGQSATDPRLTLMLAGLPREIPLL